MKKTTTSFTMLINEENKLAVDIIQENWENEEIKEVQSVRLGLEHFALVVEKVNQKALEIQKTLNSEKKFQDNEKN
jgi:hypothetical protein